MKKTAIILSALILLAGLFVFWNELEESGEEVESEDTQDKKSERQINKTPEESGDRRAKAKTPKPHARKQTDAGASAVEETNAGAALSGEEKEYERQEASDDRFRFTPERAEEYRNSLYDIKGFVDDCKALPQEGYSCKRADRWKKSADRLEKMLKRTEDFYKEKPEAERSSKSLKRINKRIERLKAQVRQDCGEQKTEE